MFLTSKFKDKVTKLTWQKKSPQFFHIIQYTHSLTPNHTDVGKNKLYCIIVSINLIQYWAAKNTIKA